MVLRRKVLPVAASPRLSGSLESCAVRHPAVITAAAVLGAIALAGCGSQGVASPTPNTVVGTVATKDAVLLVTLPPGGYTAVVRGVSNTSGIALVEIYEVP